MRDVVITSGVRTAIGDFGGALSGIPPCDLAIAVAIEAIARAGVEAHRIDQSVFGNVIHTEPRDMYLSRVAAMGAGMPPASTALTLNRLCGSGLQAVVTGAEQIMLGNAEMVLAGGAENMSRVGHMINAARFGIKMGDVTAVDMMTGALTDPFGHGHMGVTAENIATASGIDRAAQDALAMESHRRAGVAINAGWFKEQILPLMVKKGRQEVVFDTDEHVRADISSLDLQKLRAAFKKNGSVTAGNASGINDAAAALTLASEDTVNTYGLPKLAIMRASAVSGVAPELMGMGPVTAVKLACSHAGLNVADMSCIESNEAFAAQACAVASELGFAAEITNPNGGAIALGHPVGASGAIILIKLMYELHRTGGRYGLATMCIGGGQGIAVIIENPEAKV
ncbi:beta-ketothiolase BktB [Oceanospirillaceae bacterium]|nr:beta-ketothiolase BktB [Oceanospirillaceae bacterium]